MCCPLHFISNLVHICCDHSHAIIFFRSESPTQAFMITVVWLYNKFMALKASGKSNRVTSANGGDYFGLRQTCVIWTPSVFQERICLFLFHLTKCGRELERLLIAYTCKTIKIPYARLSITLITSCLRLSTQWQQNKSMFGQVD